MNLKITGIKAVFFREMGIIKKDLDLIILLLISPIFYIFFYSSFYMYKTENNVPVVIIDNDHSELSRTLIRNLDSHQLIKVKEEVQDFAAAQDRLFKMEDQAIIFIPKDFEAQLKSGNGTDLKVLINTSRFLISNDINKAVTEVIGYLGAGVRLKYYESKGYSYEQAIELIEPLRSEVKPLFNSTEGYGDFMIPAILILILQQTLLFGLSESIAKEREENTIGDLYRTAGRSMWATMTGKYLFYFILYLAYALFFFTIPFTVFGLNFAGNLFVLMVITLIFLLSIIYMSIFIASFFKKKITSLMVLVFTSYPIFFITGYSWPSSSLPWILRMLGQLVPTTLYYHAYVRITQMGATWQHIIPELIHLVCLAILGLVGARIRMKSLIKSDTDEPVFSPVFKIADKLRKS